jgi:hypothetical protein
MVSLPRMWESTTLNHQIAVIPAKAGFSTAELVIQIDLP